MAIFPEMEGSFDLQTWMMLLGAVLIAVALVLLLKQLFKLLLIVAVILALLVGGYFVAESNGWLDEREELQTIGKAVDKAGELGAEAIRKGKSVKAAIDTLTSSP